MITLLKAVLTAIVLVIANILGVLIGMTVLTVRTILGVIVITIHFVYCTMTKERSVFWWLHTKPEDKTHQQEMYNKHHET